MLVMRSTTATARRQPGRGAPDREALAQYIIGRWTSVSTLVKTRFKTRRFTDLQNGRDTTRGHNDDTTSFQLSVFHAARFAPVHPSIEHRPWRVFLLSHNQPPRHPTTKTVSSLLTSVVVWTNRSPNIHCSTQYSVAISRCHAYGPCGWPSTYAL